MVTSKDCLRKFGPAEAEKSMTIWFVPEDLAIVAVPRKIYCNRLMIEPLGKAFQNLIRTKCAGELRTWDGCFNIRKKRGTTATSLHAWGIAVDVNAAWNQFGKKPTLSSEFVKCFTDAGFDWGGIWQKPDGMHFQLSSI